MTAWLANWCVFVCAVVSGFFMQLCVFIFFVAFTFWGRGLWRYSRDTGKGTAAATTAPCVNSQSIFGPVGHAAICTPYRARELNGDWGTVDESMSRPMKGMIKLYQIKSLKSHLDATVSCLLLRLLVDPVCWLGGQQTMQVGGLLVGPEVCSDLGTFLSLSSEDHWSHPDASWYTWVRFLRGISSFRYVQRWDFVHFRCSHPLKLWICKLWRYLVSKMVEGSASLWLLVGRCL